MMELHEFDALLEDAQLPEREEQVCLRADLQVEWERLSAQLDAMRGASTAKLAGSTEESAVAEQLAELEDRMAAATVTLRFTANPRKEWMKLVDAHPPRKDNTGDKVLGINQMTFFDAIIAACLVEPKLDRERLIRLLDQLTDAQYQRIADAVWGLNRRESKVPFSRNTSRNTTKTGKTSKQPSG